MTILGVVWNLKCSIWFSVKTIFSIRYAQITIRPEFNEGGAIEAALIMLLRFL